MNLEKRILAKQGKSMEKQMEQMISEDLGIDIDTIRESSWNELEKRQHKVKKLWEPGFRPANIFLVGGNINLAQGREMGTFWLEIRCKIREVEYKLKCLRKNRKKE